MSFVTATMARIYLKQGHFDRAEQTFRELLAERPDDEDLLRGLADVYLQRAAALNAPAAESASPALRPSPRTDRPAKPPPPPPRPAPSAPPETPTSPRATAAQRAPAREAKREKSGDPGQIGIASLLRSRGDAD